LAITGSDGTASFVGASLVVADTFAVTISQTGLTSLSGTVIVLAGTPNRLLFGAAPASVTAGTNAPVTVSIVDQFNNVVQTGADATDSVTVTATITAPGSLTGNGARASLGVAHMTSLQFSAAGQYSLSASSTGSGGPLASIQNLTVNVGAAAGAPTSFAAVGATTLSTVVGSAFSTSPTVQVTDASGNGVAGQHVYFVALGECTLPGGVLSTNMLHGRRVPTIPRGRLRRNDVSATVDSLTTDASGKVTLTPAILSMSAVGACAIAALTSSLETELQFIMVVRPANTVAWAGNADASWTNAANWVGGSGAPGSSDAVFMPGFTWNSPTISSSTSVGSMSMIDFASIQLVEATTLTIAGTLNAGTTGSISGGTVAILGGGDVTAPLLPNTVLGSTTACSSFRLGTSLEVVGQLTLNCPLNLDASSLLATGDLVVQNSGSTKMNNEGASLVVNGNATFDGASNTDMTAGQLTVDGSFTQANTHSNPSSFAPSGANFVVELPNTVASTITFGNPVSSWFQTLSVDGYAKFASNASIKNQLSVASNGRVTSSAGVAVSTASVNSSGDLSGLDSLKVTGSTFPSFSGSSAASVILSSPITMTSNGSVSGNLIPRAALSVAANQLSVGGALTVNSDSGGSLSLSSGKVTVGGQATFTGVTSSNNLAGGTLELLGDLLEDETTPSSLQTHGLVVQFHGSSLQNLTVTNARNAPTHFDAIEVTTAGGLQFNSDAVVKGSLDVFSNSTATVASNAALKVQPGTLKLHANSHLTVNGSVAASSCQRHDGLANGVAAVITGSPTLLAACVLANVP
jgi:hypothetical protein